MSTKLRIAWFSPLPIGSGAGAGRSAAAYATSLLARPMSERFEVEFFHDRFDKFADYPTRHYLNAFERHTKRPFDVLFYQVEDGRSAHFTRAHLALAPGVVWFHDLVLSDFGPEPLLNSPWTEVVRRFNGETTEWPDRKAQYERENRLAEREAAFAAVALFSSVHDHGEFSRQAVRHITRINSAYLPLPVNPPVEAAALKSRKVLFCGAPGIEDRSHKLFPALVELGTRCELVWLIDAEERGPAEARAAEFGLTPRFVIGRSPERWAELAQEGAAAVHPRFSAYGRTAPYLNISMAAGLPCVITDYWGHDGLPDSAVLKVVPGAQETLSYREALRAVLSEEGSALGRAAREYAAEFFDARAVAGELASVFEQESPRLKDLGAEWERLESTARQALLRETRCLLEGASASEPLRAAMRELGWEERP